MLIIAGQASTSEVCILVQIAGNKVPALYRKSVLYCTWWRYLVSPAIFSDKLRSSYSGILFTALKADMLSHYFYDSVGSFVALQLFCYIDVQI